MVCESWKERLVALLYDELDAEERNELERHLSDCAGCRGAFAALESARSLLAEGRLDAPPVSPRVMVLAAKTNLRPWLAFAAGILFAALLMGGGAAIGLSYAAPEASAPTPLAGDPAGARPYRETDPVSLAELNRTLSDHGNRLEQCRRDNERLMSLVHDYDDRFQTYQARYREEIDGELAKLGQVLDLRRATDVDMLLREIADAEYRANHRIGKTEQTVRYIVLASQPGISEN